MALETEFPGVTQHNARATADNAEFYAENYDIVVNRSIAARGTKEILGHKPQVCRFCGRSAPAVTFGKEAHAVPELAGNRTLVSLYECDVCNDRFSAFEDDLGKMTLLARVAGQVLGKAGVPSAKTARKKSRIDLKEGGFRIEEHEGDPIADIDEENNTLTISITPQKYRPLGVFKALVKIALTLMDDADLARVPEARKWLLSDDVTTDRIDEGFHFTCWRTWTAGPAPIASTRAVLLRRKNSAVAGPAYIFFLAFGNMSFQIALPAPQEDKHLMGQNVTFRSIPLFTFLDPQRVKGPTKYWTKSLSSSDLEPGTGTVVFNFDSMTEVTPPEAV